MDKHLNYSVYKVGYKIPIHFQCPPFVVQNQGQILIGYQPGYVLTYLVLKKLKDLILYITMVLKNI